MSRFCGVVGYVELVETKPGVYEEQIEEHTYYGDVYKKSSKWEKSENLNDNINVNQSISIVADEYAYAHFSAIRYVNWMGSSWKVTSIEVQRPRLILSIGGVYNVNKQWGGD